MTAELIEDTRAVRLRMPRYRDWTWADLQRIQDDGHRYEIIDGSLHASPGPSRPHQVAAGRVRDLLLASAPDDLEVIEAVDIQIGRSLLQPDVVVLPAAMAYTGDGPLGPEQVLLAVEVVSPSSRRIDRLVKPSILAEAGVPAYWRVELEGPDAPSVVLHELAGGVHREVRTIVAGETVTVEAPFRVELRPAGLTGPRGRD